MRRERFCQFKLYDVASQTRERNLPSNNAENSLYTFKAFNVNNGPMNIQITTVAD